MHEGIMVCHLHSHPITGIYACVHQMEAQAEEQAAEAQKERKLRERNEQYSRQLEEELEGLKVSLQTGVCAHPYKLTTSRSDQKSLLIQSLTGPF